MMTTTMMMMMMLMLFVSFHFHFDCMTAMIVPRQLALIRNTLHPYPITKVQHCYFSVNDSNGFIVSRAKTNKKQMMSDDDLTLRMKKVILSTN